jgi:hypothetical protein
MPNNFPSINLAKNKQISLFDKFIDWTLTVGRLIVIVTEIIAVTAFIYRFSLDDKLIRLRDLIKSKHTMISSMKDNESLYRNIQDRIALAAKFSIKAAKPNQTTKAIKDIVDAMPKQISIEKLDLNENQVKIGIGVVSVPSLSSFVESLRGHGGIKSVSIDDISNNPLSGLSVNITAMIE